ncbi:uracil-DNA glycosylase family protein [Edaphobacter modestus]|uniref:uracil-DNA glycosylase family protein n=1 Tax=Edaphobacter modestus TaxID=388466 RepID=UPI0030FE9EB1
MLKETRNKVGNDIGLLFCNGSLLGCRCKQGFTRLRRRPQQFKFDVRFLSLRTETPWLEAELEAVQPELIVCLGATAAQSLLGAGFRSRSCM